ncbi:MAG: phosphoesterase [Acidobacteriaceae bacterium]|nr:phosphoesterase [Acidobacteriaceae bacterium]
MMSQLVAPAFAASNDNSANTTSPIKHVIVIIGENRTFDHVFATYKPKSGESVDNLLSKGIVNEDGSPGPNFAEALQYSAVDTSTDKYQINPMSKSLYSVLPPPLTGGPSNVCKNNGVCTLAQAEASENGLTSDYYKFLLTGGTGQASHVPDTRIMDVTHLAPGPFQLTSSTMPYDTYAASPVHRFYQMWQQEDCDILYSATWNPSGCRADLFPWVEVTIGAGSNGKAPASPFTDESTGEGSTSMGFYNVLKGDAPYLKSLADKYAMSDNYHQAVMGGTGANHIMLGTGDAIWYDGGNGNPANPPHNASVFFGTPNAGIVDEVENPNAAPGTNNWYTEDGYGGGAFGKASFGGGSYTNCSDPNAPGVSAIVSYLSMLPRRVDSRCEPGHYYLLNNYNPGYFGDGSNASTDNNVNNTPFTVPPSTVRNIGDALLAKNISFAYFGDQFNAYLNDKYQLNYGTVGAKSDQYCNICNFLQYSASIMTNKSVREAHLKDTTDFYNDIKSGSLPAVSFVKPSGWVDGHPASSKLDLFEGFVKNIVDMVQANPTLWASTAIFVTFDEGGGYYDSGYIQPLDYFGDGTRIPLLVVSPFTKAGHISHDYTDHVSILKFIERNWGLSPLTGRSRDNFPNPQYDGTNKYAPTNGPAIGDLFDLFAF